MQLAALLPPFAALASTVWADALADIQNPLKVVTTDIRNYTATLANYRVGVSRLASEVLYSGLALLADIHDFSNSTDFSVLDSQDSQQLVGVSYQDMYDATGELSEKLNLLTLANTTAPYESGFSYSSMLALSDNIVKYLPRDDTQVNQQADYLSDAIYRSLRAAETSYP
ncbi:hypothetical protein P8C59_004516 [Phyllachora maydis]|uniref:Uncharacterized protein n=1 Tax=Phyllachora maydis TaxID=1825666 RepID=A0AAD9MBD0_9PEZI|nr:hypothetical protein P8C59_004516 [Phyllachora maydis]